MSNLNRIDQIEKLFVKQKEYVIPKNPAEGQEQIKIIMNPLSLKDMGLINMDQDSGMDEISKNVTALWAISLGISEEESGKISVEFMKDLMDAFIDVNNFDEADMKNTGIKEFMAKKQEKSE